MNFHSKYSNNHLQMPSFCNQNNHIFTPPFSIINFRSVFTFNNGFHIMTNQRAPTKNNDIQVIDLTENSIQVVNRSNEQGNQQKQAEKEDVLINEQQQIKQNKNEYFCNKKQLKIRRYRSLSKKRSKIKQFHRKDQSFKNKKRYVEMQMQAKKNKYSKYQPIGTYCPPYSLNNTDNSNLANRRCTRLRTKSIQQTKYLNQQSYPINHQVDQLHDNAYQRMRLTEAKDKIEKISLDKQLKMLIQPLEKLQYSVQYAMMDKDCKQMLIEKKWSSLASRRIYNL